MYGNGYSFMGLGPEGKYPRLFSLVSMEPHNTTWSSCFPAVPLLRRGLCTSCPCFPWMFAGTEPWLPSTPLRGCPLPTMPLPRSPVAVALPGSLWVLGHGFCLSQSTRYKPKESSKGICCVHFYIPNTQTSA